MISVSGRGCIDLRLWTYNDGLGATIDTEREGRESRQIGQTSAPFHINCSSFLIVIVGVPRIRQIIYHAS